MKINPVKGCLDYMPKEMELRQQVIEKILKVYKRNGFLQIKTPILENLENLTNGDSGDNTKLMFKTIKRGEKLNLMKPDLQENDIVEEGLRYDLTVPLARFFTKNRADLPYPFKSIQIDDSFRAEKPQEGRNRQFTQCDIDIWGEKSILAEIEIILTVMNVYNSLKLPNVKCRISSRKILSQLVLNVGFDESDINNVCVIVDKLDKIGLEGCKSELIQKGFDLCVVERLINALEDVIENGIVACGKYGVEQQEIENMLTLIDTITPYVPQGYEICFDISIVRGQGYYTGFVFEMFCYDSGYKGAIGGGGRYDTMYGRFAGGDVPAVGYGLGLDSVLLVLKKLNIEKLSDRNKIALIYRNEDFKNILAMKNKLAENFDVSIFAQPKNFKEFLRKIKLNGYEFIMKMENQTIEEI